MNPRLLLRMQPVAISRFAAIHPACAAADAEPRLTGGKLLPSLSHWGLAVVSLFDCYLLCPSRQTCVYPIVTLSLSLLSHFGRDWNAKQFIAWEEFCSDCLLWFRRNIGFVKEECTHRWCNLHPSTTMQLWYRVNIFGLAFASHRREQLT